VSHLSHFPFYSSVFIIHGALVLFLSLPFGLCVVSFSSFGLFGSYFLSILIFVAISSTRSKFWMTRPALHCLSFVSRIAAIISHSLLFPFRCYVSSVRVLHSILYFLSTLRCIIVLIFVLVPVSFDVVILIRHEPSYALYHVTNDILIHNRIPSFVTMYDRV
jgi:hypothetical protein